MTKLRDTIYADPLAETGLFAFDDSVARVFPDMIKRSVPGYTTIVTMTGLLAGKYAIAGSTQYDLGCSLGASTLAMRQNIQQAGCHIIAVDNSSLRCWNAAGQIIATDTHDTPVSLTCSDLQDVALLKTPRWWCSTLRCNSFRANCATRSSAQSTRADYPVVSWCYRRKVTFEDPHLDELNIDLHHQFKRANGYSELEVARKRSALENVLLPETLKQHKQRISSAGFSSCDVWFQCFNFASLVALK